MRSVAIKAEFPELEEARMQIFTMRPPQRALSTNDRSSAAAFHRLYQTISENLFLRRTSCEFSRTARTAKRRTGPERHNKSSMRARVYVSMKPSVLDPQGQTICNALNGLGHKTITGVRQGKYFDITVAEGTAREKAQNELDEIARDVLSNGVIEDYRVEILD